MYMMKLVKDFYKEINPATLTGAIDVIVVEQPDGSFKCSPFHVRFGKLGVLRSREKVVDITINGEPQEIHMKLGESGEAFFVEEILDDNDIPEHLATSPIPVSEFDDLFKHKGHRRSFDLDDLTELNNLTNETNDYTKRRYTADNQASPKTLERNFIKRQMDLGNLGLREASAEDMTLSLTTNKLSSEDLSLSNNDISETIFKMDSLDDCSKTENLSKVEVAVPTEVVVNTPKISEELSSETKSSKKKRKKMKKKNAPRKSTSSNLMTASQTSETLDKAAESATDRSSLGSNCSESELKELRNKLKVEDPEPTDTVKYKKIDEFHFFSDTELTTGNAESRANLPIHVESVLSDSEIEVNSRPKEKDPNEVSKSWEWGGFPKTFISQTSSSASPNPSQQEQEHKSMLSSVFSFMRSKHGTQAHLEGGMYLSDITSGGIDQEVASIYFSQATKKNPEDIEVDCESGNGPSLTQSPGSADGCKSIDSDFDDQVKLMQAYSQDMSLSMCGWDPPPSKVKFLEHVVKFSDLCNNPVLFEDPNLVVRIKEKYYTWKVASPIIASIMIYGRPLVQSSVERLCSTYMPSVATVNEDAQEGSSKQPQPIEPKQYWWSFRRGKTSREVTPAKDETSIAIDIKTVNAKDSMTVSEIVVESSVTDAQHQLRPIDIIPTKDSTILNVPEESGPPSPKYSNPDKCRKSLRLTSKQIRKLHLKEGVNEVEFSVTTAYQGTTRCQCYLYKWKWDDKIVISDIDGTITRSDVLGHLLPMVGKDWAQSGVAQLFNKIQENGYKLLYLSARAIGQAGSTRDYLKSIRQGNLGMPDGPMLLNPTSLIMAFHREVIEKKPEQFKISCLSDIKALFPEDANPFYAGYGNRINDVWAYTAVGIPIVRIFTINPKGELRHELTQTFQSSYSNMSVIVDQLFPTRREAASDYSQFAYWREPISQMENIIETIIKK